MTFEDWIEAKRLEAEEFSTYRTDGMQEVLDGYYILRKLEEALGVEL